MVFTALVNFLPIDETKAVTCVLSDELTAVTIAMPMTMTSAYSTAPAPDSSAKN